MHTYESPRIEPVGQFVQRGPVQQLLSAHMQVHVDPRGLYPVVGLAALGQTLLDLGAQVDVGAGVEAALAEIAQASPTPA